MEVDDPRGHFRPSGVDSCLADIYRMYRYRRRCSASLLVRCRKQEASRWTRVIMVRCTGRGRNPLSGERCRRRQVHVCKQKRLFCTRIVVCVAQAWEGFIRKPHGRLPGNWRVLDQGLSAGLGLGEDDSAEP